MSSSVPSPARTYLPFIDWMKAAGIVLIVMGHVAGRPTNHLTPPIYPKQLGVAFFVFVLGYSLARNKKSPSRAVVSRLFELYLFGLAFALLMSVASYATSRTFQLSNYLPMLAGSNVLVNDFPANPTTWYIGTYTHLVLIWAVLLRRLTVTPGILCISLAVELPTRAMLAAGAGGYVAYMLFTNWFTVFLAGMRLGQRKAEIAQRSRTAYAVALGVLLVCWPLVLNSYVREYTAPFMRLSTGGADGLVSSACVSFLYLIITWLLFRITRELQTSRFIRFLARNTLFVFIAHMPVYWALDAPLVQASAGWWLRTTVQFPVCLIGLALVSEWIHRLVDVRRWRDCVEDLLPNDRGARSPMQPT